MKILIDPITKKEKYENVDGLILSLKDYSVQSINYYTLEEIKNIKDNNNIEIFVSINKNLTNNDIEPLKEILLNIDKLNINGILFYDSALLQLKKELNIKTDLVWASNHMVNNYTTCDFYHSRGVNYAYISREITLDEIKEIVTNTKVKTLVEVVGLPTVAFSKRKLIRNFYSDLGKTTKDIIKVGEKVTKENYILTEDNNGTSFYLDKVVNGTGIIKELNEVGTDYIVLREYGIDKDLFYELIKDTKEYINNNCNDNNYIEKYKCLGDFTNFFFKKTIYKVKKNG